MSIEIEGRNISHELFFKISLFCWHYFGTVWYRLAGASTLRYSDALHSLEKILQTPSANGRAAVVLLLDGLNEAGTHREPLLREIENLGKMPGVGILITERTEAVLDYGLPDFVPLALLPLTDQQVRRQFDFMQIPLPDNDILRNLLTTPMLLFLYLDSVQFPSGGEQAPLPQAQEELLTIYLDRFYRQTLREDSGNQASQLINSYILLHLLPSVAWEMRRKGKTILTVETVRNLVKKSERTLRSHWFGEAFPDFLGKSRLMLAGIQGIDEWYDLAVRERLMERFGLLLETSQGQITLLHDAFLSVLASQADKNRSNLKQRWIHHWRRRLVVSMTVLLLIGSTVEGISNHFEKQSAYTVAENVCIQDKTVCFCGGSGTITCKECSGAGTKRCATCAGEAFIPCPNCSKEENGGQASDDSFRSDVYYVENPGISDSRSETICPYCSGTGQRLCGVCDGSGSVKELLDVPYYGGENLGDKWVLTDCPGCHGKGYTNCLRCGGDGKIY